MLVRLMQELDIQAMHNIHTQCVREICAVSYNPEVVDAWLHGRSPEGYLKATKNGERIFVAEDNGEVLGFASWKEGELYAMFVSVNAQGKGAGRKLFEACEQDAVKHQDQITKLEATLNSQPFYESLGFKEVGRGFDEKRGQKIAVVLMEK